MTNTWETPLSLAIRSPHVKRETINLLARLAAREDQDYRCPETEHEQRAVFQAARLNTTLPIRRPE